MTQENKMQNDDALKPCPFCGNTARLNHVHCDDAELYQVGCFYEDCEIQSFYSSHEKYDAIEAWNTRANANAPSVSGEVLEQVKDALSFYAGYVLANAPFFIGLGITTTPLQMDKGERASKALALLNIGKEGK